MDHQDYYAGKTERDATSDRIPPNQTSSSEKSDDEGARSRPSSSNMTTSPSPTSTPPAKPALSSHTHALPRSTDIEALHADSSSLNRIHTSRSQHSQTVGGGDSSGLGIFRSKSSRSRALPAFGAGKPYPPSLPNQEDYVVEFDGEHDPLHAQNWALGKKLFTALMLVSGVCSVSFLTTR
jgi:DHA1 family multidrug resistance protein-like MFS transporter